MHLYNQSFGTVPSLFGVSLGQSKYLLLHNHILQVQLQYRQLVYDKIRKYCVYNLDLQGYCYEYHLQGELQFHGRWPYAYRVQVFVLRIRP